MPKRKLTKSERYQLALKKHIKYLRSLGLNVDDNGRIILTQPDRGFYLDVASRTFDTSTETRLSEIPLSNKVGNGGTKPDNSWKIEEYKNFTIVPAYNKGPYMVVNKRDLKTAGRKV